MLDKKDLSTIRKSLVSFDAKREVVIKTSRDILRFSKQAISSVHRGELSAADKHITAAQKLRGSIEKLAKKLPKLAHVGAYRAALQEYVEAVTFVHFVRKGKLLPLRKVSVSNEDYLMGVSDLTGELSRRAVLRALDRDIKAVKQIRGFVVAVHDYFLTLDLRNGELRKKYDAIKWNLKKIEDILYDLTLKGDGRG